MATPGPNKLTLILGTTLTKWITTMLFSSIINLNKLTYYQPIVLPIFNFSIYLGRVKFHHPYIYV